MSFSELQDLKEMEELDIQLKVFNENKEEDREELSHRLDDIHAEMEYPFRWFGLASRGLFVSRPSLRGLEAAP